MTSGPLIDLSPAARQERQLRARRRRRLALPFAAVALMIAGLLLMTAYSYRANRRAALGLSRNLVGALVQRTDTEVSDHLHPAADSVRMLGTLAAREPYRTDEIGLLEPLFVEVLGAHRQLTQVYLGDPHGGFIQSTRMSSGAIDTKVIRRDGDRPEMYWVRRDVRGRVVRTEVQPFDNYDPRTRPWYGRAAVGRDLTWTDVYVFHDPHKPGVTASFPVRAAEGGELLGVMGADIGLDELSNFLAHLRVGTSGQAIIVDGQGRIVAAPDPSRSLQLEGDRVRTALVAESGDPVLTRAYNRSQIEGPGWRTVDVAGRTYLSSVSPLSSSLGNPWSVLVVVPEEDLVGFVAHNSRNTLLMSSGVVAGAIVLAGVVGVMAMGADRRAQAVREQRERLRSQSEAFSKLAGDPGLLDADDRGGIERLTEAVAAAAGVRRVSVWRLADGGRTLVCEDAFDRACGGHTSATELDLRAIPELARALAEDEPVAAPCAAEDSRTVEFEQCYLRPLGLEALLVTPIRAEGRLVGALLFEDESRSCWHAEIPTFARAVAAIVGVRLREQVPGSVLVGGSACGCPPHEPEAAVGAIATVAPRQVEQPARSDGGGNGYDEVSAAARSVERPSTSLDEPTPDRHEDVTALVIHLQTTERGEPDCGDCRSVTLLNRVICRLEALAESHGVGHVAATGETVVCVAQATATSTDHANAAADLALRVRQLASAGGGDDESAVGLRMGIHTGPAIGALVGRRARHYEFTGEAVQVAALMAESCPRGAVQVTAATYRRLRTRYLLQNRGLFFVVGVGDVDAYLLRDAL